MEWNSFFIKDVNEYLDLKAILEEIIDINKEIPNQVFQKEYRGYLFQQFDNIMSEEFFSTIRGLAEKSNDDYIVIAVLNPHPMDYYYKEFGYFNWAKLPLSLSNGYYWSILNEGPPNWEADAIVHNSFIIAFFSPSRKWGIWADRNYEISVIAFNEKDEKNHLILESWLPVENEEVVNWMKYSFRPDYNVPQSFTDMLKRNYQKW
ncbi:hypothetical protein [Bacillus alkalicellulosilyticus]|uniref:hypothetical protein n=1 Tax=Alkalihalobacterium alkalicellulosilyticum TaxID=1912214 RepID=UPI00099738BE|nr:hypothetical protein [Bacillus alkalicellulosilyticus]